jgi:hypothetical protein
MKLSELTTELGPGLYFAIGHFQKFSIVNIGYKQIVALIAKWVGCKLPKTK